MHRRCLALLLLALPAFAGPLSAAPGDEGQDTVYKTDGNTQQVDIKEEKFSEVVISLGGGVGTSSIPRAQIVKDPQHPYGKIDYGDVPNEFDKAQKAMDEGNFTAAAQSYGAVADSAAKQRLRPLWRQHGLMGKGRALMADGKAAAAIGALGALMREFPDGVYLAEGFELLVDAYTTAGKADDGRKYLDDFVKGPGSKPGLRDEVAPRAQYLTGRILEVQKDYDKAIAAYNKVSGMKAPAELKEKASLGIARCTVAKGGDVSAAEKAYRDLAESATLPVNLAGAWNGIGDCYLKRVMDLLGKPGANTQDAVEPLRQALRAYLHGVVLYKAEGTEQHALALGRAGKCYALLMGAVKEKEQKDLYRSRARDLLKQCVGGYPGTAPAKEAQTELTKVGG